MRQLRRAFLMCVVLVERSDLQRPRAPALLILCFRHFIQICFADCYRKRNEEKLLLFASKMIHSHMPTIMQGYDIGIFKQWTFP